MSRCMCMMRLQRHMGGVARIGAKLSMTFELAAPPDVDAEPDFEADVDSEGALTGAVVGLSKMFQSIGEYEKTTENELVHAVPCEDT